MTERAVSAFHRSLVLAGEPPCYTSTRKGVVYCPHYAACAVERMSCTMFGMYLRSPAQSSRKLPHGLAPSRALYRQHFAAEDHVAVGQQAEGKRGAKR